MNEWKTDNWSTLRFQKFKKKINLKMQGKVLGMYLFKDVK